MATESLAQIDGDPKTVAQESLRRVRAAHRAYVVALEEAEKWIRNASMTEILSADEEAQVAAEWTASWEQRLMRYLDTAATKHSAYLGRLANVLDKYEGYGE